MEVDKFSGLIGLAPDGESSDMKTFLDQIDNGGNPATNSLTVKKTTPISAIFSIYLSQGQAGKVIFGGYDLEKYAKKGSTEQDIFWSSLPNHGKDKYWTVGMKQVDFGKSRITPEDSSRRVVLDTGLTYAMMPFKDFNRLIQILKTDHQIDCTGKKEEKLALTTCTFKDQKKFEDLPKIDLML